jgi:predicted nucleic acid-binding protein
MSKVSVEEAARNLKALLEQVAAITTRFQTHLDSNFYLRIPLESVHYQLARDWIGRFDTSLRTLDALHLACASSNNLRLVTADDALARSAEALSVEVQLLAIAR